MPALPIIAVLVFAASDFEVSLLNVLAGVVSAVLALPLGPWIETDLGALGLDPGDLAISCTVDGEPRQQGRTSQLLFGLPRLISHISQVMTLLPGDVILTGTPEGVGPMAVGDEVEVTVAGIGSLTNKVASR